mmetsp:Transcript_48670/g.157296  ORF Transcript_48670/g.157296 Transcript_48670/m.157296 type:complete len:239 (+) Transcript_48670:374-1090(+)
MAAESESQRTSRTSGPTAAFADRAISHHSPDATSRSKASRCRRSPWLIRSAVSWSGRLSASSATKTYCTYGREETEIDTFAKSVAASSGAASPAPPRNSSCSSRHAVCRGPRSACRLAPPGKCHSPPYRSATRRSLPDRSASTTWYRPINTSSSWLSHAASSSSDTAGRSRSRMMPAAGVAFTPELCSRPSCGSRPGLGGLPSRTGGGVLDLAVGERAWELRLSHDRLRRGALMLSRC